MHHQELFSKSAVFLMYKGADGFLFAESLVDWAESQVTRVRYWYIAARWVQNRYQSLSK